MTFRIENVAVRCNDNNNAELKSNRFPVVINGDRRLILRMTVDNQLIIYDERNAQWKQLTPEPDSVFDVDFLFLRDTFSGTTVHRFLFSVFPNYKQRNIGDVRNGLAPRRRHRIAVDSLRRVGQLHIQNVRKFATQILQAADQRTQTHLQVSKQASDEFCLIFWLLNSSRVKLEKRLETMFYWHCSSRQIAFVNKHIVGFAK